MKASQKVLETFQKSFNAKEFHDLNWSGSFEEYLDIVSQKPEVARSAYQRIYHMILSYGTREYVDSKKKIVHYKFFDDPKHDGRDAIYGLDISLMKLVNIFKSAAHRYGTEKRVLLLHGPVGSAKSTIARLLKRGLEDYSRTDEGALYTYSWINLEGENSEILSPMHQEPLLLMPLEIRESFIEEINKNLPADKKVFVSGDLNPACRQIYRELMQKYEWK